MLVCVTGGTGFVGAHSVAALLRAGCQVRLLVRDKAAVGPALRPLGVEPDEVEICAGDICDEPAVSAAVRGADAVLHAASVYSFDSRRAAEMRRVNLLGTETVLDAALRADVGRIVYVSSIVAMYPAANRVLDARTPVGRPRDVYMATKAAADEVARGYQEVAAPVFITYPPALLGPHDPHRGDQTSRLRYALRGLTPIWPTGGFPVGDVRDTAELHAAVITEPRPESDRLFGPGRHLTTRQYMRTVRRVTGRRLPSAHLPGKAMLPLGRMVDGLQKAWPWHIPAEYGAIYTCACDCRVAADAPTQGVAARPVEETFTDTVRWLHAGGQLTDRQAGAALAGRD
ncbi:SDR family NAD(P)-dependent oxidoreductase [Streptomyces polygonati]|uniref:SDR family NAD(P)-dependent oxidoreductase n=1 Tax=Streptomyces polygonati TaxID=1617087 RepID=A0ABV8HQ50_9ACTN